MGIPFLVFQISDASPPPRRCLRVAIEFSIVRRLESWKIWGKENRGTILKKDRLQTILYLFQVSELI